MLHSHVIPNNIIYVLEGEGCTKMFNFEFSQQNWPTEEVVFFPVFSKKKHIFCNTLSGCPGEIKSSQPEKTGSFPFSILFVHTHMCKGESVEGSILPLVKQTSHSFHKILFFKKAKKQTSLLLY